MRTLNFGRSGFRPRSEISLVFGACTEQATGAITKWIATVCRRCRSSSWAFVPESNRQRPFASRRQEVATKKEAPKLNIGSFG